MAMEEMEDIVPIEKENNCAYPICPSCGEGNLVPFSYQNDVYEKWKCTKCRFVLPKKERSG